MGSKELLDLLLEIEAEDPIDYADLPFDEDDLRRLACCNVSELLASATYQGKAGLHPHLAAPIRLLK